MRKSLVGSLAVLVCAAAVGVAAPGDWPQWRGPNRDGVSTATGLLKVWPEGGPKLLWNSRKVNNGLGVGTGFSSVAVADGRLFTQGDRKGKGYVFALDADTGRELWATVIGPAQSDGPRCTPTVDGNRVYALSRQGDLVCLAAADGSVLWQKSYKKELGGRMMSGWDYSESPLVDGDRLICTPGGDDAALVALNKHTGELIWKAPVKNAGGSGYASIVKSTACGIPQYVTLLGRCIVGVAAADGKFLWRYDRIHNGTANIPTPVVWYDYVFCTTGYGTGSALLHLDRANAGVAVKEVYFLRGNVLQNHHGGVIRLGDYIYGGHGHNNGLPFCLDVRTGKLVWGPERGPGSGSAAVVYADGNLYFRYENGVMALVEATPEGYHLKSHFQLPPEMGTPSWPHPVVAHGRLYLRGRDVLLCYDLRQ
jgi:outer membrane protein assembly factor BamB